VRLGCFFYLLFNVFLVKLFTATAWFNILKSKRRLAKYRLKFVEY